MRRTELIEAIKSRRSYLCVGLDPDENLLPESLKLKKTEGVREFCLSIIDATAPFCVAFKPNFAFFEAFGREGWNLLDDLSEYLKLHHPNHFLIADAKRGDIGNTSSRYAKGILEGLGYDAITVSPYMGKDSVQPFFLNEKWVIVLMLTSNSGSENFQKLELKQSEKPLYLEVGKQVSEWGNPENLMFVTGATHPQELINIRKVFPEHFFLIPGVGAQGGSIEDVSEAALTDFCGILVNSSRGIIHASSGEDYLEKAVAAAGAIQQKMSEILTSRKILNIL
jgi:orotidine-5'-phosphate decarboxylase